MQKTTSAVVSNVPTQTNDYSNTDKPHTDNLIVHDHLAQAEDLYKRSPRDGSLPKK